MQWTRVWHFKLRVVANSETDDVIDKPGDDMLSISPESLTRRAGQNLVTKLYVWNIDRGGAGGTRALSPIFTG